jgi:pyrroloquinoline-quinone synthase
VTKCPACLIGFARGDYGTLAQHLVTRADESDSDHVRWLNQNLTRRKTDAETLVPMLGAFFDLQRTSLTGWVKTRFIAKFFGKAPHPFVVALQHPSRATLLGYVFEHQHFLRQWVRSCAFIMARTDQPEVIHYELDNLNTEFGGFGADRPSHYDLLLRMGESLGVSRSTVMLTPPLPATRKAIEQWNEMATREHWVSVLTAMHSLELIANRNLVDDGASIHYFDPAILNGNEITPAAQGFLREGYEADVEHSDEALALASRFARDLDVLEEVQAVFLRSIDLFDDYLIARLERAGEFEA